MVTSVPSEGQAASSTFRGDIPPSGKLILSRSQEKMEEMMKEAGLI